MNNTDPLAEFDTLGSKPANTSQISSFDLSSMSNTIPTANGVPQKENNINSFLGIGADLVNLDNLVKPQSSPQANPFAGSTSQVSVPMGGINSVPVQQQTQIYPQFGAMASQPMYQAQPNFVAPQMTTGAFGQTPMMQQQPMYPQTNMMNPQLTNNNTTAQNNPFLL